MKTYLMSKRYLEVVEAALAKVTRRAERLGVEPPVMRVAREFPKPLLDESGIEIAAVSMVEVEISSLSVKLPGGWRFVGVLEPRGEGNLLREVPGMTADPRFRTAEVVCEHCHTNRYRKETYLVENPEGRQIQVGSSCIRDYLGHRDPAAVAAYFAALDAFSSEAETWGDDDDDFEGGGGGGCTQYNGLAYLAWTAAAIRADGWTSSTRARETGRQSTADYAFLLMTQRDHERTYRDPTLTPADWDTAKAAIAWIQGYSGKTASTYIHNLKLIFTGEFIYLNRRDLGFAASLIPTWRRAVEEEIAKQKQVTFAARPGDKIDLTAVFTWTTSYCTQFGTTQLYKFAVENGPSAGATLVWKTSTHLNLEPGARYRIRATVKAHETYREEKQTVILRAKVDQA